MSWHRSAGNPDTNWKQVYNQAVLPDYMSGGDSLEYWSNPVDGGAASFVTNTGDFSGGTEQFPSLDYGAGMVDGSWNPTIEQSIFSGYDDPNLDYNFDQRQRLDDSVAAAQYANDNNLPYSGAPSAVSVTRSEIATLKDTTGHADQTVEEFIATTLNNDVAELEGFLAEYDALELDPGKNLSASQVTESYEKNLDYGTRADEGKYDSLSGSVGSTLDTLRTKLINARELGHDLYVVDDTNDVGREMYGDNAITNADWDRINSDPSLSGVVGTGEDSSLWNIKRNEYQDPSYSAEAQRATAMGLWGTGKNEKGGLKYPHYTDFTNPNSEWWSKPENAEMAASLKDSSITHKVGSGWTRFVNADQNDPTKWYTAAGYDSSPDQSGISKYVTQVGPSYDGQAQKRVDPNTGKVITTPGFKGGVESKEINPMWQSYADFEKGLENTQSSVGVGPTKFAQNFGDGVDKVGGAIGDIPRYASKGVNYLSKGAGKLFGLIPGDVGNRLEEGFNQFGAGAERLGTGVDNWMGSAGGNLIEGGSAFGQGMAGYLSGDARRGNASMGQAGRNIFEAGRGLVEVPARGISDSLKAFQIATNANISIGGNASAGRSSGSSSRNPSATKRTTTPSQRSGSIINNSSGRSNTPGVSNAPGGATGTTGPTGRNMSTAGRRESPARVQTPNGSKTVDLRTANGQKGYLQAGGSQSGLNQLLASLGLANKLESLQLMDSNEFDLSEQYQDVDYTPASRPQEDHSIEELAGVMADEWEEPSNLSDAFSV